MRNILKVKRSVVVYSLIVMAALGMIGWDLSTSLNNAVENGTFRYEADFDVVTGATMNAEVGIVTSDNAVLPNPIGRDKDLTYEQVEQMVAKAIEFQGGFDWVLKKGNTIMIKINLVGANSPSGRGENTDVRVVKALVKLINTYCSGDCKIIIAEGSPTKGKDDPLIEGSAWHNSGYVALLTDAYLSGINFRLLNLNEPITDIMEVDLGRKATSAKQGSVYRAHKEELMADVYITVPVLKVHDTGITNALKLQVGSAPSCFYGYNKSYVAITNPNGLYHDVGHRRWTDEMVVDLCQVADIDFVVVDALMCLERRKSYIANNNNQVRMNTIIAGVDPVAVDHVCARLFCLNPDDVAYLTLAEKMGLGINNLDMIDVIGNQIDEVKKQVVKSDLIYGKYGQSNRTWILSKAFTGSNIDFEYIPNEAKLVPRPGVDEWTEPVFFFDDRIDLRSFYNDKTNVVTYAFTQFSSPTTKPAQLWLGVHEGMKVYLNGVQVFKNTSIKVYPEDASIITTDYVDVNILAGENTLLVKTVNTFGDYTFAMNVCETELDSRYAQNRVEGLKFYINRSSNGIETEDLAKREIQISAAPVPARYSTEIKFTLPQAGNTLLTINDLFGRVILVKDLGFLTSGIDSYIWDLKDSKYASVETGNYICTIQTGINRKSLKIAVQK